MSSQVDQRRYDRRALEELAARLFAEDGIEVDFCPLNVSQSGLAIVVGHALAVNSHLRLVLSRSELTLRVRWCQPIENNPANYRVGLEPDDALVHLDELIKQELSY